MLKTELLERIGNGENSGIEFQRDDVRPEQLAREIAAFANFRGGQVLLGVEDDGTITGIQRDGLKHWVIDTVSGQYVHPTIVPRYEELRIDEQHQIAVITVTQGTAKPYVVRHDDSEDIYVRIGSTSRRATPEQQAWLRAAGGVPHADLLPVSGSFLADLSLDRLRHYLHSIVGDEELPSSDEEWCTRLCDLGFMVEAEGGAPVCTIAGLVLFGYSPRRLLRQAGVRWMAFERDDRGYTALDDRLMDGPLVALRSTSPGRRGEVIESGLFDNIIAAMRPFVSEEFLDMEVSVCRERKWSYPEEAIREAIINAVAHRDWTRNEEVEIARYTDRLEIQSPGTLQNSMTVEKMKAGRRFARNQLIVNVLRDYGYMDVRGRGVRNKIMRLLRERNGTEPEFDATEDYLKVTMLRGAEDGTPSNG